MALDKDGNVKETLVYQGEPEAAEVMAAGEAIPVDVLAKIQDPASVPTEEWQTLRKKWDAPLRELRRREDGQAEAAAKDQAGRDDKGRFTKDTGNPQEPGGDGQSEAEAKADAKPGEEQSEDKLQDFLGKRLARERRKAAKQMAELKAENERLKAEAEGKKPPETSDAVEGEPDIDDPKYADDAEGTKWLADWDAWQAKKNGKPAEKAEEAEPQPRKGQPETRTPEASPGAEAVADLVRSLEGADEEGKLATEFDEGLGSGKIVMSDELVEAFDAPGFPEEEFVRIARMFVEKPWLSKKVSRQEPGTQLQALSTLLQRYESPDDAGGQPASRSREPLRGSTRTPGKAKDAADYAESGDFESFVRVRKSEEREKTQIWQ